MPADALSPRPRSTKKRPITNGEHLKALFEAAKRLSPEHWEVVLILYRTGIEVKALSKITWRDFVQGKLIWRRPKRREELHIPVDDDELLRAVRGYIGRPRRSADHLDRLVVQAFRESGVPELAKASPMTLRLTRCYLLLTEGRSPESIARQLSLAPALVRDVAATAPPPRGAADETAAHGRPLGGLNQP